MGPTRRSRSRFRLGSIPVLLTASLVAVQLLAVPVQAASAVPASVPSDMAAHWALDEGSGATLSDAVSGQADGQISGGTTWVAGSNGTGHALSFDGVDGAATILSDPDAAPAGDDASRSGHAGPRPATTRSSRRETGSDCAMPWAISTGDTGSLALSVLTTDDGTLTMQSSVAASSIWDGTWHFLAVTVRFGPTESEFHTWVDGVGGAGGVGAALTFDTSVPGPVLALGGPRSSCSTGGFFAGELDDVRIYDRSLAADEIGSFPPQIPTTITIEPIDPMPYCAFLIVYMDISPTPGNAGWLDLYMDDGSGPRLLGSFWTSGPQGRVSTGCFPVGNDVLTATFRAVPPFETSSSAPLPITVTMRDSRVIIRGDNYPTPLGASATIWIDAQPGGGSTSVYETTGGEHRLVGVSPPDVEPLHVAGLGLGTHTFIGEYSGDAQTLPSVSLELPIEVVPAVAPTASMTAVPTVTMGTAAGLAWSASQGSALITSYDVRFRRAAWNGSFGSYVLWQSGTTATDGSFHLQAGSTYCFSARAHDELGLVSAWTTETCTFVPLDDRSLTRSAGWTLGTGPASTYLGGTYVLSSTRGAKLTRTGVVARRLSLIATTCSGLPGGGRWSRDGRRVWLAELLPHGRRRGGRADRLDLRRRVAPYPLDHEQHAPP